MKRVFYKILSIPVKPESFQVIQGMIVGKGGIRMTKVRIPLLDEARGAAILCMVFYHLLYDLRSAGLWDGALLELSAVKAARNLFAGFFIGTAGCCCHLSHDNWRRGGVCILAAGAVSLGAGVVGLSIRFGVLHLMGSCILLAALLNPYFEKIPSGAGILLSVTVAAITAGLPAGRCRWLELPEELGACGTLYPLGLIGAGFISEDYYPLLPWAGIFFAGYFLWKQIMAKGIPPFATKSRSRFLAACGRKTLLIYLLHQPVLMGLLWLYSAL